MAHFETADLVEGEGTNPQDRVAVFCRGDVVIGVVADGAGGTSGGAAAATFVLEALTRHIDEEEHLLNPMVWMRLLLDIGSRLESGGGGQTTAVIAATDGRIVVGASVGDSEAWVIGDEDWRDLSAGQSRKPLLGGGEVDPRTFIEKLRPGDTLLLATDGVLKYANSERICSTVRTSGLPLADCCAALVRLVRLPNGGLHDDAGIVLIRMSP